MSWDSFAFFSALTKHNVLASSLGFVPCRISGLEGFEEALQLSENNLVCISDVSEGFMEINSSPFTRSVKSVFFAMRHAADDLKGRMECMDTMREIFRQFMSVLIREKIKLEEKHIYLDTRISFNEIDRFFFNGAACCYFQIAVDLAADLRLNKEEWAADPSVAFSDCFTSPFRCSSPAVRKI